MRKTIAAVLACCLSLSLLSPLYARAASPSDMSTEEKISQMIMPAFRWYTDDSGTRQPLTELTDDVSAILARHGFAGVVLFAQNTGNTAQATRLVDAMQRANASVSGRSQLLIAVDQEGGLVTRLGQGTQMPGNMALGAVNDIAATAAAAELIGKEVLSIGCNFNFAPVLDVNSNPENPVIGLRSFSDDSELVARHGVAYMQALQSTGVISSLKHFPGHGDTATDSHTGLPCINKSYEQLKSKELIPFRSCIDAGADAVMTAHIQYPQIEKQTWRSVETGEEIYLPATLSKIILTDILRGDMGFDGVIITDAMDMDAIARHFGVLDASRLAIEAGADILLMPVDTSTREGMDALEKLIRDLAALVENGTISRAKVDAAVTRILALKERKGLLTPYNSSELEDRVKQAVAFVGSTDNHAVEWGLAKRSITLLKNERGVLPLAAAEQSTLVLTMYNNEVMSMNYALARLREDGKLRLDAKVDVRSTQGKDAETVLGWTTPYDHIVCITETGSLAAMDPQQEKGAYSALLDRVIETVHTNGGDVTILSASLPYDAARYQAADAIVLAWSARGMSEDPRSAAKGVTQYGPNLPAALYLLFAQDESPEGKLPVAIQALDGAYGFSGRVLYPRGSGLRYPERAPAVAEVGYMPGVTKEMTEPSFWANRITEPDKLLATTEEIAQINAAALTTSGSNMHDLKNLPETFNGTTRNAALQKGVAADAAYYLGWTYNESGKKLEQSDFDEIIANCVDPNATPGEKMRYGIAANRTTLLTFPYDGQILDDPVDFDFDYQALVSVRMNEPVAVFTTSADGKFYQVVTSCCSGWLPVEDVAICKDKAEWLSAWDIPADRRLVFYGDKMYTDYSKTAPETSARLITMATVLERMDAQKPGDLVSNRLPLHNYAVYLPVRNEDGSYAKVPALINAREMLSEDYLPLTGANLARVALASLGGAYGWGGSLQNEDCTSLNRSIFLCFGLNLPRNGNWQWVLDMPKSDVAYMTTEEKEMLLDKLPLGTLLTFPGHQMMYLGKVDGAHYVVSTVSSIMSPWSGNRQRTRDTQINALDVKRANGQTWIQAINRMYLPWQRTASDAEALMAELPWYHAGTAFCLEKKLIDAFDGGYFRPAENATRATVVEAIWRAANKPAPSEGAIGFADVQSGASYEKAVLWAKEQGIVNGVDGCFLPDDTLTREQLAVMLYRWLVSDDDGGAMGLAGYDDAGKISAWAYNAMGWAVRSGLINGKSEQMIYPGDPVTRAELAVILQRAVKTES